MVSSSLQPARLLQISYEEADRAFLASGCHWGRIHEATVSACRTTSCSTQKVTRKNSWASAAIGGAPCPVCLITPSIPRPCTNPHSPPSMGPTEAPPDLGLRRTCSIPRCTEHALPPTDVTRCASLPCMPVCVVKPTTM